MNSKLIEVNVNSTFESILNGKPNGQLKQFIFEEHDNNKTTYAAQIAQSIGNKFGVKVYTAVQIPFGSRPKRIEIVFACQDAIYLTKITNSKKWDSSAIELQAVISTCLKSQPNLKLKGLVLVDSDFNESNTENFIIEHANHVIIQPISSILDGLIHGISNQSSTSG